MPDLKELEELAVDLASRLQAIEGLSRAETGDYQEDSVVDMQTLSGAGLVAFMGNFSDQRLDEIVAACAAVRQKRLHAPQQVFRAQDKEEPKAEGPPAPRKASMYIIGEGLMP